MPVTKSSSRPAHRALSAVYPMPARHKPAGEVFAVDCPSCQLPGHTHREPDAVSALLKIHDDHYHGGIPTSRVVAVPAACDICDVLLAILAVPVPEPGQRPVAVCGSCSAGSGPMIQASR